MSASSSRRGLWIALGAVCILGGLVAAVLLWNGASQRRNSAIENFARAPIGCDTTLDFIEPGEYLLFVETVGNLDGVRGNCDVEGAYDNSDEDVPDIEITLVDPDGDEVDLDRSFGDVEYDAAGFRGVALRSVDIEETDDHVLRAESDVDEVFVVAVGRDPNGGVAVWRTGAIAAGLIGLLAGLALLLVGVRRSSANVPAGPWTPGSATQPGAFAPGGQAAQGPPDFGHQGGPPQYAQPGTAPQQFGQPPRHGAQQPGPPPAPQYGQQPHSPRSQPPPPPPSPRSQQAPSPPHPPQSVPGQPDIPGQPTFPQAPADPAGSVQPIDWAPQTPAPPPSPAPPDPSPSEPSPSEPSPSDTAPPDADFLAQLRDERSTQERPPPPPPN